MKSLKGISLSVGLLSLVGLSGCESISPDQVLQAGLQQAIRGYAGQDVSNREPRGAYRQRDDYRNYRADDQRYVRETTGYQRFGPYRNARGQEYVVVREYYSDGSYEDSPQLY